MKPASSIGVPNILIINSEDPGYVGSGGSGSTANSTRAIDQLAKEGTLITDFHMAPAA